MPKRYVYDQYRRDDKDPLYGVGRCKISHLCRTLREEPCKRLLFVASGWLESLAFFGLRARVANIVPLRSGPESVFHLHISEMRTASMTVPRPSSPGPKMINPRYVHVRLRMLLISNKPGRYKVRYAAALCVMYSRSVPFSHLSNTSCI